MNWYQVVLLLVTIVCIGAPMLYVFGIKEKEMHPNVTEIHDTQALRIENAKLRLENAKLRDTMFSNAKKHALHHMYEDELRIWATQQSELIEQMRNLCELMWNAITTSCTKCEFKSDCIEAKAHVCIRNKYIEYRMDELGMPHD